MLEAEKKFEYVAKDGTRSQITMFEFFKLWEADMEATANEVKEASAAITRMVQNVRFQVSGLRITAVKACLEQGSEF